MRVLSRADLEPLLTPRDMVAALADAFTELAAGRCDVPERSAVAVGDDSLFLVMPAAVNPEVGRQTAAALGAKLVTFYPGNRARGHPTHLACYLLLDHATGRPLALLEAGFLTAFRTGATSALAAQHLARPDSRRIVCFGTSVQAGFQLRCLASVLPIERVTVVGRDPERARAFAAAMARELDVSVEALGDRVRAAAVRDADVITCATTATDPVFAGQDLRPGTHVDAVGAFRPDVREVDTETVRRARVAVETYAGVLSSAGDLLIPMRDGAVDRSHVVAELAELVTGRVPGRTRDDEITLFKSVGFALEDLAAARLAYNRAMDRGLGVEVRL